MKQSDIKKLLQTINEFVADPTEESFEKLSQDKTLAYMSVLAITDDLYRPSRQLLSLPEEDATWMMYMKKLCESVKNKDMPMSLFNAFNLQNSISALFERVPNNHRKQ